MYVDIAYFWNVWQSTKRLIMWFILWRTSTCMFVNKHVQLALLLLDVTIIAIYWYIWSSYIVVLMYPYTDVYIHCIQWIGRLVHLLVEDVKCTQGLKSDNVSHGSLINGNCTTFWSIQVVHAKMYGLGKNCSDSNLCWLCTIICMNYRTNLVFTCCETYIYTTRSSSMGLALAAHYTSVWEALVTRHNYQGLLFFNYLT